MLGNLRLPVVLVSGVGLFLLQTGTFLLCPLEGMNAMASHGGRDPRAKEMNSAPTSLLLFKDLLI